MAGPFLNPEPLMPTPRYRPSGWTRSMIAQRSGVRSIGPLCPRTTGAPAKLGKRRATWPSAIASNSALRGPSAA